ncbi:hypothetical protein NMG60_11017510 [Bertholletia excelsa]
MSRRIPPSDEGMPFSPPLRPSSRRTLSLSSTSSNSSNEEFPLFSPSTPLRYSGIPFSWEQLPGIPKKQLSKKRDPSLDLLPLPPAGKKFNFQLDMRKKSQDYSSTDSFRKDPFFAALIECSKDDQQIQDPPAANSWKGLKVSRTLSDRFGFVGMYASCRRACPVSQSIIYIPRSHHKQ